MFSYVCIFVWFFCSWLLPIFLLECYFCPLICKRPLQIKNLTIWHTGWSKSRIAVVHMGTNIIINKNTRINFVSRTHSCNPALAPLCIANTFFWFVFLFYLCYFNLHKYFFSSDISVFCDFFLWLLFLERLFQSHDQIFFLILWLLFLLLTPSRSVLVWGMA